MGLDNGTDLWSFLENGSFNQGRNKKIEHFIVLLARFFFSLSQSHFHSLKVLFLIMHQSI